MERVNMPNDDFREKLTATDIERVCGAHNLPTPKTIVSERRGNDKVAYHLDDRYFLAFVLGGDMREEIDKIAILSHVGRMPIPRMLAWSEREPFLGVPYYIQEDCPGSRLDLLWEKIDAEERVPLLEGLGYGMGYYHTVTVPELVQAKNKLSLNHIARYLDEPLPPVDERSSLQKEIKNLLPLAARLSSLGIDADEVINEVRERYVEKIRTPRTGFVQPGLVHEDPFEEHFFVERTDEGYRLSGCVDIEGICISDGIHDVGGVYASMLALDRKYYEAFKKGYEQFFPFPPDAEDQLRFGAITDEICGLTMLTAGYTADLKSDIEWPDTPLADWAMMWTKNRFRRLQGWLDEAKQLDRALFRPEVGPW